ncbi:ErfK/YbiS/YcfS/YnhG [Streptomyces sp. MUSC 125]|uniref:L,D-transpeptidase n=1 Tax=Streptomyces sp. MUSC 125 TaxID=1428624 RepID=UPI00057F0A6C|nr:L,D-transpeptidase [Streptomyces sp. MUSC 125]KIE27923.1 ErfK/YbiS/YcfS/YnhG [Streptomyces sp. MUSC 125]
MERRRGGIGIALVTAVVLVGASGCGGGGTDKASGDDSKASGKPNASASPSPTKPAGPPMLLETITPQTGTTVGVAMPVSVVFTNPVAAKARATVEKHMKVSASQPVVGAWHWLTDRRADWRPKAYWPSGTTVRIDADLTGVRNGNGRYGVHNYTHTFKIGDDVRAQVSVTGHTMKVTRNGRLVRTLPINAGSAQYPTWNGTMAVIDKQEKVHMTSCSVHISCDKGSPNYYDLTLPWDVHLTQSGTYVHYSNGDPTPGSGSARGSHGCVHLSKPDAKWFYGQVKQGDPVTITGSSRAKASAANGYADFNLGWEQWLAGSASGQETTGTL